MTLEEACEHWGVKQSEVDFISCPVCKLSWRQDIRVS